MRLFVLRPFGEAEARAMIQWRYEPPYDIYNLVTTDCDAQVRFLADPRSYYYAIVCSPDDDLVGFCCFEADARVPGGDYTEAALDIGLGVRPDRTGRGLGQAFVEAVIAFGCEWFSAPALRVTIAEFNARALRVWERAGFERVGRFTRADDGRVFLVLMRAAPIATVRLVVQ